MTNLQVAYCEYTAAKYAVTNWHYSGTMPAGRLIRFGVWERGKFIGAVIYGRGASQHLVTRYGLAYTQGCELARVALTSHEYPVSQIVASTLSLLRQTNPGLRLVVSFADPHAGHHGGIYQAGNWLYTGETPPSKMYRHRLTGKLLHERVVSKTGKRRQFGVLRTVPRPDECDAIDLPGKHVYLMPLDRAMRRQLSARSLPYPDAVSAPATI